MDILILLVGVFYVLQFVAAWWSGYKHEEKFVETKQRYEWDLPASHCDDIPVAAHGDTGQQ